MFETVGIEIISHDAEHNNFCTRAFDNQDNDCVMSATVVGDKINFVGEPMRFAGGLIYGATIIEETWEFSADANSNWTPWMKVRLAQSGDRPGQWRGCK